MKILVLAPLTVDQKAAAAMLSDHETVIVGTYDDAQNALTTHVDKNVRDRLMADAGYPKNFNLRDASDEVRKTYWNARDSANIKATVHPDFDVVMTSQMVPASNQALGREGMRFAGQKMILGETIALLAIAHGVKMVAVLTTVNHHNHPASAAFDCFGDVGPNGGDVKVLCTNRLGCRFDTVSNKKAKSVDWNDEEAVAEYERRREAGEIVSAQGWAEALAQLIGKTTEDSNF